MALVIAAAGVKALAERRTAPPVLPATAPVGEVSSPAAAPAALGETIRQRLSLIQRDLRAAPEYPLLLGRATECCLALALVERERSPEQARLWIDQANLYLRPLREKGVPAAAELQTRAASLAQLRWTPSGPIPARRFSITGLPRDPGQPPLIPTVTSAPSSAITGGRSVTSSGEVNDIRGEPPPFIMGNYPGPHLSGPSGAPTGEPGFKPQPPPSPQPRETVETLRAALAERPQDLDATWKLAEALERNLIIPRRARGAPEFAESRARAMEAYRLYLRAVELSPTQVQRGTFYYAAAQVQDRLGEDEECYRLLKKALAEMPYSVPTLQRYRDLCVRTGRMNESERATALMRKWSTPEATL